LRNNSAKKYENLLETAPKYEKTSKNYLGLGYASATICKLVNNQAGYKEMMT